MYTTHPRTKNTAGYLKKGCVKFVCFGVMDDSSNWKFMLAEGDTYSKWPDDETYPLLTINYIKLDRVASFSEGWGSVVEAMRAGSFYGTTGEVLFHSYGV